MKNHIKTLNEYVQINEFDYKQLYQQLGGNKFAMMVGAKNLVYSNKDRFLSFRIGGGAKQGINYVKITLNGYDLYDMEFGKIRGNDYKVIATENDVYFDELTFNFTKHTGFYASL